jgi:hypothetical protein
MEFLRKFGGVVTGILNGFDRLVFRGTLRSLSHEGGVVGFLLHRGVRFVDFGPFVEAETKKLVEASLAEAREKNRPIRYLASSRDSKEEIARRIAREDGIDNGLVCVLKCVEPCWSFELHRDAEKKKARIEPRKRKCLFLYHYWMDEDFGFMSARIQTWLPYAIQVCVNGREWLARALDREGVGYRREDNALFAIEDLNKAQALADKQLRTDWPRALGCIARHLNPAHDALAGEASRYYWSVYQSEWASDVLLRSPADLAALYPKFVRGAIGAFGAEQVMRYLRGRPLIASFQGRVVGDARRREEGVRVKHWVGENSIKMYDKPGGILRIETTINDPSDFQSYRPKEGDPGGAKDWRAMRRGVADLARRGEVSQSANARYLDALASLETGERVGELAHRVCRPVRWNGARIRALRPWSDEDEALLAAVARGEFAVAGFRNRDLRAAIYGAPSADAQEERRRCGRTTRQLRLLRAHRLIRKVGHTHRYILTEKGRRLTTAVLQTKNIPVTEVMKLAA